MNDGKALILARGEIAMVDASDWVLANKYKWYKKKDGYVARTEKQKTVLLHRFIMNTPQGKITDHINGNKLDNRRENLRICGYSENAMNRKPYSGRPYKGVYWFKDNNKWGVKLKLKGKSLFFGLHENEKDAARVYNIKARELFGQYALLNNIDL